MFHLIGQSAEDLVVMSLTDALSNHVPQISQHGHEWKRLGVCKGETLSVCVCVIMFIFEYLQVMYTRMLCLL